MNETGPPRNPLTPGGDVLLLLGLSLPSFLVVFLGVLLAIKGHPDNPLSTLEYLDLFGVFVNLLVTLWLVVRLFVYDAEMAKLRAHNHLTYSRMMPVAIVSALVIALASLCAALTVNKADVQGHAIAISLTLISAFWMSFSLWYLVKNGSSAPLAKDAGNWAFRYDLPATLAYLAITLFIFNRLGWRFSVRTDDVALDSLHNFLSGAVALHLSLSGWTFLLDNFDLLRAKEGVN
jgi:hypothetical protein